MACQPTIQSKAIMAPQRNGSSSRDIMTTGVLLQGIWCSYLGVKWFSESWLILIGGIIVLVSGVGMFWRGVVLKLPTLHFECAVLAGFAVLLAAAVQLGVSYKVYAYLLFFAGLQACVTWNSDRKL